MRKYRYASRSAINAAGRDLVLLLVEVLVYAQVSIRSALVVASAFIVGMAALESAQDADWVAYGRDPGGERFSPLDA